MTSESKKEKTQFFKNWTGLITLFMFISGIVGFCAVMIINSALGHNNLETGTYLVETANYCAASSFIAAVIGLTQWLLLRRKIKISSLWILACIAGILISESLAGFILWKLEINRANIGLLQGGRILPEILIFTFTGALIGIFQFPLLKRNYHKAGLWIPASIIAWVTVPLAIYALGGITLGAITGATLIWILQKKEVTS